MVKPDILEELHVWPAGYGEDAQLYTVVSRIMNDAADEIERLLAPRELHATQAGTGNAERPVLEQLGGQPLTEYDKALIARTREQTLCVLASAIKMWSPHLANDLVARYHSTLAVRAQLRVNLPPSDNGLEEFLKIIEGVQRG